MTSNTVAVPLEPLESRLLLAADLSVAGVLDVTGTRKADTIFVTFGPDRQDELVVRINKDEFSFSIDLVKAITIQAGALSDHVEFRAFATTSDRFDIPTTIFGSTGDDLIVGSGAKDRIYGGTGSDSIFGGFARDIVYGEEGDDTLDGGAGHDYLSGGDGGDRLVGGLGQDRLFGDAGNDSLVSRADRPFRLDMRPFLAPDVFDQVDGGGGKDQADADAVDRLVSVESTFVDR